MIFALVLRNNLIVFYQLFEIKTAHKDSQFFYYSFNKKLQLTKTRCKKLIYKNHKNMIYISHSRDRNKPQMWVVTEVVCFILKEKRMGTVATVH